MSITHPPETAHPPDVAQFQMSIADVPQLARSASWADKLSLRIGLWLLLRSAHRVITERPDQETARLKQQAIAEYEANITRARLMVTQLTIMR